MLLILGLGPSNPMVSTGVCALVLLLHHVVPTLLMVPRYLQRKDVFSKGAEKDMMRSIRIPDQLLRDIMEEADKFRDLFEYSPSTFLSRCQLHVTDICHTLCALSKKEA